jgi:predicted MFS family arabinose efflux permease
VAQQPGPGGSPVLGALRSPVFWLLSGSFFICGTSSNGIIGVHFVPHSIDHGIPEVTAASVLAIMGAMNFVGTLASGWLTDRYDPRMLLAIYYSPRGLSLLLLPFVTEFAGLPVFAVFFGLDYIATVPPTLVRREQQELWNHTGELDAADELFAADQAEAAKSTSQHIFAQRLPGCAKHH